MKEEEVAGVGYLLTFFNDVEQLVNSFTYYLNKLLEIKALIPDPSKLDNTGIVIPEKQRLEIIEADKAFKTWLVRCHIKALSLRGFFKTLDNDVLDNIFNKNRDRLLMDIEDAQTYTIEINKAFAENTLRDMLFNVGEYSKLLGEK